MDAHLLAAVAAVTALRCGGSGVITLTFRFLRMAQRSSRAIEGLCLFDWDRRQRLDELE
jgi:hypothetical protein